MNSFQALDQPLTSHREADRPQETSEHPGRILIVDDVAANVRLLEGILKVEGFEVAGAYSGAQALEKIPDLNPDVVLLDVMMPDMDGFEVCCRLRRETATAHLPVVMVTALHETEDRIRAIEAGADDFLSKPVDSFEVVARVRSLVRAKRDRDALEKAYRDLKHAEQMRDSLGEMLVHDLRTPLTTILASLDMIRSQQAGPLTDLQLQVVDMSMRGGKHLLYLINELLDIGKLESGEMRLQESEVKLSHIFQEIMPLISTQAQSATVEIHVDLDGNLPSVWADDDLLQRVFVNLLANAVKFSRRGSEVSVKAHTADGEVQVCVRDQGEGIRPEDQGRIFEKFGQVESRKKGRRLSTGLGLTFCKLAVEAHGGRIWVESVPGDGSTFWVAIPIKAPGSRG